MTGLEGIAISLVGLAIMLATPLHKVLSWHSQHRPSISRILHKAYPVRQDDGSAADLLDKLK
jgi:hypothetical protein